LKKETFNNFIFSNKLSYRVQRHATFWAIRILFISFTYLVFDYDVTRSFFSNFWTSFKIIFLLILLAEVGFCYLVIYYLAPKYFFRKKYIAFVSSFLVCMIIFWIGATWYLYRVAGTDNGDNTSLLPFIWKNIWDFLFHGPPAMCCIMLAIKIFKSWYQKQQEKIMLIKANADAEIQLLKAQIHPHFLFNTLNNIYSFALARSPQASVVVRHLNDTLSYMIKDCSAEFVSLKKEIKLLQDYISLEQIRYGNRLEIQTEINGNIDGKKISPLLMIPFVENSFKHGTSKMLEHPWIKLLIEIKNSELCFNLSNSKPPSNDQLGNKKGIGLKNVKKRLMLLYPQTHHLDIESLPDTFTVQMKAPLFADNSKTQNAFEKISSSLI